MDKNITQLETNSIDRYEVEIIRDRVLYTMELDGHLLGLCYILSPKGYLEKENTWEPLSAVEQLQKVINLFHKNRSEKLIATFLPIDSALPMARLSLRPTKPITKTKRVQLADSTKKQAQKN